MQKLIVQVAAEASLKHCVPPSLPLPVSVKRGVVFHLAKGDSVNEAGELLWVMKEAYIVFSLLLALQAPVLLFPLLFNSSARVACRQELTPETSPQKVASFLFLCHSLWSNALYSRSRFSRLQVQPCSLSVLESVQPVTHWDEDLSLVLESQQEALVWYVDTGLS